MTNADPMSDPSAVRLRPRSEADLDTLFAIAADLETWEERTEDPPRVLTRAQFDERLASNAAREARGEAVSFVVDVDGVAVGSASLFSFDFLARHAEAGIVLAAGARGRGIGTAAIIQLVEFGFVRRNLRRIHLQAIESNVAAIRAYEKAGFVIEGRQREHAWVRGRYEDTVRMGILRSAHPDNLDP
ncbi:MAG: GNAT family N-acetyltransferase [Marmoricola sp.]